jgi:SnoaL-like domain
VITDSLSADDRSQLLEIYARSVMFLELGRCKEWADLFDPQALVLCTDAKERAPLQFKGRNELLMLGKRVMLAEFEIALEGLASPLRCRHTLSNIMLFGGEPRRASGYALVNVTTVGGNEAPRWLGSWIYSDTFHKCSAGCWRFESRKFTADPAITLARETNQRLTAGR